VVAQFESKVALFEAPSANSRESITVNGVDSGFVPIEAFA
jgi:hypothetical protein